VHGFVVNAKKRFPNGKAFLEFGKAFWMQSLKRSDAEKEEIQGRAINLPKRGFHILNVWARYTNYYKI